MSEQLIAGCDFSSSPNRRKPIVLALGRARGATVTLERLEKFESLPAFEGWLAAPGAWVGGFDTPFGLPRELVETLGWPLAWEACMRHYAALDREDIRSRFKAFCDGRPAGGKFAHRATDLPAGSSPSMKWVNPPVAWMLHAVAPLLLRTGVHLPGLHAGDPARVALEAYPGLLARELIGRRSYKSDAAAGQTHDRLIARKDILTGLEQGLGRTGLRLRLTHAQRDLLADDAKGDCLDAVLCLVQAAWAAAQGAPRYGMPADADPLEGWIIGA